MICVTWLLYLIQNPGFKVNSKKPLDQYYQSVTFISLIDYTYCFESYFELNIGRFRLIKYISGKDALPLSVSFKCDCFRQFVSSSPWLTWETNTSTKSWPLLSAVWHHTKWCPSHTMSVTSDVPSLCQLLCRCCHRHDATAPGAWGGPQRLPLCGVAGTDGGRHTEPPVYRGRPVQQQSLRHQCRLRQGGRRKCKCPYSVTSVSREVAENVSVLTQSLVSPGRSQKV